MKAQIQRVLDALRDFITQHHYEDTPILTAYVGVDSTDADNRRDRPAWLIELKNEAKRIEADQCLQEMKRRDTKRQWADTEEAILSHLQDSKPQGRSIVIFTDHQDFLTLDLPVPMPTRLSFGLPQVKPLLFALDRYRKYLVVLFSEEDGKMVEVFLTAPTEEVTVNMGPSGGVSLRPGGRTSRTQASERRDLDTERRVAADAAEAIHAHFTSDSEFEHIVFGGNLKMAHAVKHALHPAIYDQLVSIERIAHDSTPNEIAEVVKRVADETEAERDLATVDELISRRHACGTAVLEWQGVLAAIEQGQANKVYVSVPLDSDEFDELMLKSVLADCEIGFVHGDAAKRLNEFGGVAATLYYSGR